MIELNQSINQSIEMCRSFVLLLNVSTLCTEILGFDKKIYFLSWLKKENY